METVCRLVKQEVLSTFCTFSSSLVYLCVPDHSKQTLSDVTDQWLKETSTKYSAFGIIVEKVRSGDVAGQIPDHRRSDVFKGIDKNEYSAIIYSPSSCSEPV